jgi:hypothetical protein
MPNCAPGFPGRLSRTLLAIGLFIGATACCHSQAIPETVAVREAQARSDDLTLPLTPDARSALLAFLRAGGNRDFLDEPPQVPDADARYGALLDLLAAPETLKPDALTNGTYQRWFSHAPIRQVIDARQEAPPALNPPYAMTDGPYWWVFHRGDDGTLSTLVVFKAVTKREEPAGGKP